MPSLNKKIMLLRPISDDWEIYSSSTFTTDSPVEHIQHKRPGVKARSTDTTSGTPLRIRMDCVQGAYGTTFDPDDVVVFIGYVRTNGSTAALEYRVRMGNSSTFAGDVYDSGSGGIAVDEPFADRDHAHAFDNPTDHDTGGPYAASQYVEVTIWTTGATWIDVGRIFVGIPWQPALNIQPSGLLDPTTQEDARLITGDEGQEFDQAGVRYMVAGGTLIFTSKADLRTGWEDLTARVGKTGSFLYVKDPTEVTYRQQSMVYGRFSEIGGNVQTQDGTWVVTFGVKEFH